jgi:3-phosphoshikimate 1-carboxyvinyltransferase
MPPVTDASVHPDPLPIERIGPFRLRFSPPGSKSLTNRALLLAALADGTSHIRRPLVADDTQRMVNALGELGVPMEPTDAGLRIEGLAAGTGRLNTRASSLYLENAGTATRFLTAVAALSSEPILIDGNARMRERPIGELVDALRELGAIVEYEGNEGFPPLRVHGPAGGLQGGELTLPTTASSQFISALLQIGPLCAKGLTLNLTGRITSPSYIRMTVGLMRRFGAEVTINDDGTRFEVAPVPYRSLDYLVEPDASSATYFLAAAAITPGAVCTIEGLGRHSLQGDVAFADVLARMGAGLAYGDDFMTVTGADDFLQAIDIDMSTMPDAAMTLAAVACFARGETVIRGLRTLRVKETDRLAALQAELTKIGATVEIESDDETGDELLAIEPPASGLPSDSVTIATYNDHRMAMSLAVVGAKRGGVLIEDPGCVQKTYPEFWDDFGMLVAGGNEEPSPAG